MSKLEWGTERVGDTFTLFRGKEKVFVVLVGGVPTCMRCRKNFRYSSGCRHAAVVRRKLKENKNETASEVHQGRSVGDV